MQDTVVGQSPKDDAAQVAKQGYDALMAGKAKVVAGSRKTKCKASPTRCCRTRSRRPRTDAWPSRVGT
jgi:hypothetical protein